MYLLIVTGLSGAGKSLALHCFEEQGFFCVDNLPSSMLKEFVNLCNKADPAIRKAAVTIDSRESLLSRSSTSITEAFDALDVPYELLFLDARDDVLRKRYNEVRRRHPLGEAGDAATGVKRERVFLQPLRDRANYILDTSDIKPKDFPALIAKVLPEYESKAFTLLFCSFGYKRGVPVDADFVGDLLGASGRAGSSPARVMEEEEVRVISGQFLLWVFMAELRQIAPNGLTLGVRLGDMLRPPSRLGEIKERLIRLLDILLRRIGARKQSGELHADILEFIIRRIRERCRPRLHFGELPA